MRVWNHDEYPSTILKSQSSIYKVPALLATHFQNRGDGEWASGCINEDVKMAGKIPRRDLYLWVDWLETNENERPGGASDGALAV